MKKISTSLTLIVTLIFSSSCGSEHYNNRLSNHYVSKRLNNNYCDINNYTFNNYNFNQVNYSELPYFATSWPEVDYVPNLIYNNPLSDISTKPIHFYSYLYNDLQNLKYSQYETIRPTEFRLSTYEILYSESCIDFDGSGSDFICFEANQNTHLNNTITMDDYEFIRDEVACLILSNTPQGYNVLKILNIFADYTLSCEDESTYTRNLFVDVMYAK